MRGTIIVLIVFAILLIGIVVSIKKLKQKRKNSQTKRGCGAQQVDADIIKGQTLPEQKFDTVGSFLAAEPLIDCNGLPMQQKLVFPEENTANKRLCDQALLKMKQGDWDQAFLLYRQAGHNGSCRGRCMSAIVMAVSGTTGMEFDADVQKELGEWLVDLAFVKEHPLGLGLELLFTAIMRSDTFDGVSEEIIEERKEEALSEFAQALSKGDLLAHYLLIMFYAGAVESIVPEVLCEDDEKYERAVIHFSRYYNVFRSEKNSAEELSFVFDHQIFTSAFCYLFKRLYDRKDYVSALATGRKAIAIARENGDTGVLCELTAARIAMMYLEGKGTPVDLKSAKTYLVQALCFSDEDDCGEYTNYVRNTFIEKERAQEELNSLVSENSARTYFDLEEAAQKLRKFSDELERQRRIEEEKIERERIEAEKREQDIPPLRGYIEKRGGEEYFVTAEGRMPYKLIKKSEDKKEITIDRGWLYGIQTYKMEE